MKRLYSFIAIGGIVVVLLLVMWLVLLLRPGANNYRVNVNSQTVIKQIRSLNRLETSSYTIEKIVDAGTTGGQLRQLLFGDRILLIAHGEAIAGFDMNKIKDQDIEISRSMVKVRLPAPEILVSRLDNEQTRVYDRRQGVFTRGDSQLESEARKEAELIIKDAACKGGILQEAEKNGRSQLTALFKSLGFITVVIDIPQGSC